MGEVIYTVVFYATARGSSPFMDWLKKIKSLRTKQVIEARIERLKFGNLGDTKVLGQGVMESRIHFGPGYRIYYAHVQNTILLLLIAGDKSTQNEDIKKAKKYWKEYNKS